MAEQLLSFVSRSWAWRSMILDEGKTKSLVCVLIQDETRVGFPNWR